MGGRLRVGERPSEGGGGGAGVCAAPSDAKPWATEAGKDGAERHGSGRPRSPSASVSPNPGVERRVKPWRGRLVGSHATTTMGAWRWRGLQEQADASSPLSSGPTRQRQGLQLQRLLARRLRPVAVRLSAPAHKHVRISARDRKKIAQVPRPTARQALAVATR